MDGTTEVLVSYGFIKGSTYRRKVMEVLYNNPVQTPTNIAKLSQIRINHISNVLKQLKDKGLIYCLNEDARKGRLYQLTELGTSVCVFYYLKEGKIYNFESHVIKR